MPLCCSRSPENSPWVCWQAEVPLFTHHCIPRLILISILLIYCGLSLLGIFAQERAYTQKHFWKPYKIFEAVVSVFIVLNLAFMSISTHYAYSDIESKKQELRDIQQFQIETILNLEFNEISNLKSITTELENIYTQQNYTYSKRKDEYTEDAFYERLSIKNTNMDVNFINSENFENYAIVSYSLNTHYNNVFLIGDDIYCDMTEFSFIREGMSLDDFLKNGLHKKSVYILKDNEGQLTFGFIIEDGNKKKLVNINFYDNIYTMDEGMFSSDDTELINYINNLV